jgi:exopolysaccharide biosynthesis protein
MRAFLHKPYRWAALFSGIMACLLAVALLATFVLPVVGQRVQAASTEKLAQIAAAAGAASSDAAGAGVVAAGEGDTGLSADTRGAVAAQVTTTGDSYSDGTISIAVDELRVQDTTVFVASVKVPSVAYLKTALAGGVYGRNIKETTSEMADDNGAILAINGDFYGFDDEGFVLRNGVLYRSDTGGEVCVVGTDGQMSCMDASAVDASILAEAWQIWTFGPALIQDGQVAVGVDEEISGRSARSNPRTAIGQVATGDGSLEYLFVVSGGRDGSNAGLSLYELAQVMQDYGCEAAYNLDGGGSSCMVFNGQVLNSQVSGRSNSEREVSDIVYIGY